LKIFDGLIEKMFPSIERCPLAQRPPSAIEEASREAEKHPYAVQVIIDRERSSVDSIIARAIFAFPEGKAYGLVIDAPIDIQQALWYRIRDARRAVGRRFHNLTIESLHPKLTRVEATAICIAALYSHDYLNASELSYIAGRYYE